MKALLSHASAKCFAKRKLILALAIVALPAAWLAAEMMRLSEVSERNGVPEWPRDEELPQDCFTFVRLRYNSGGWRRGKWATDFPDSDLNFSYRLQELTSIQVDPDPVILDITDPKLGEYPFVYMIEPGRLLFEEEEVNALRAYLLNGGFMMVDDFWGEREYENFREQITRVFPDRPIRDIPPEHPIFDGVFKLKTRPQIPSIHAALAGREQGITWERWDAQEAHYQGIYDDDNRLICIICHNTDLGDGWEREGEDPWYFKEFSEKSAYPLGINIIYYAMTH